MVLLSCARVLDMVATKKGRNRRRPVVERAFINAVRLHMWALRCHACGWSPSGTQNMTV